VRRIIYSIARGSGSRCLGQWVQSIRSLRRYNSQIAVHLFLYAEPTTGILREAEKQGVSVHSLEEYCEILKRLSPHGAILSSYPTFHKFLSLCHAAQFKTDQLLYLDCDTFIFDDIEILFEYYSDLHWYAREEPRSRHSHLAPNPNSLDEGALDALAERQSLRRIWPFNSGVCLLNHGIWHALGRLKSAYLETAWRLMVGWALALDDGNRAPFEMSLRDAVRGRATESDRSIALPYPSANHWIIEQVTLWLTLGHLPTLSQGLLSRDYVVQGGEFVQEQSNTFRCVLAHYFSVGEAGFFRMVKPLS
jgi:hypothetical protein